MPSFPHQHVCFSHQERRWPERHLLCLHHDPGDDQVSQHGRHFLCCKDPPQLQAKHGRDLGKHQTLLVSTRLPVPVHPSSRKERCWGMLTSPQKFLSRPKSWLVLWAPSCRACLGERPGAVPQAGADREARQLLKGASGLPSSCCADMSLASAPGLSEILPRSSKAGSH